MHVNEVVKRAFELMRAEMLETVMSLPEESRPNLGSDILYGIISNPNIVRKIGMKMELETKMQPMTYGVDVVKQTNWG